MEYIKILSPQNCVIFQQRLTMSDSRTYQAGQGNQVHQGHGVHQEIHHWGRRYLILYSSCHMILLAMPNHLCFKTDQAGRGNQVNHSHGVHQEIPTGGEGILILYSL